MVCNGYVTLLTFLIVIKTYSMLIYILINETKKNINELIKCKSAIIYIP